MKDYKPKHSMVRVNSLNCYVATPAQSTTKGVIMFADMFGVHTGRHKQFCDMLAENGFMAVCPDFLEKSPYMSRCTPTFGMNYCCAMEFLCLLVCGGFDRNTRTFAWDTYLKAKVMDEVLVFMKSKGVQNFGAVGFCWGTYGAMQCAAFPDFKCCAGFHPSNEGFCKATKEDDLEVCRKIKCPQLMISTKNESARWKADGEAHKACLAALPGKVTWKSSEQNHGYMTRGDPNKLETFEAVKQGCEEMLQLLKENL